MKDGERSPIGFLYQSRVSPNVRATVFLVSLPGKKMFFGENRPLPKIVEK
jgi:hypothetical protein